MGRVGGGVRTLPSSHYMPGSKWGLESQRDETHLMLQAQIRAEASCVDSVLTGYGIK